jgi:type VI secretion system secreted protein VgrG
MATLELSFASGEASLSARKFAAREALSAQFTVDVWAFSRHADIDLEAIVGEAASFRVVSGLAFAELGGGRSWNGICSFIEQVHAVGVAQAEAGQSTYHLRIVPRLWLLTQRRNYRIFQHVTIPAIVDKLLGEWGVKAVWQVDRGRYPKLEYRVQHGESDFAFLSRLLEEAGITFSFHDDDAGSTLTLADEPHGAPPRAGSLLRYVDEPNQSSEREFITDVRLSREVRPGGFTLRDHDFRNPGFSLLGAAQSAPAPASSYEIFQYSPGAFLIETGARPGTPHADDKGTARYEQAFGAARADQALHAERVGQRAVAFATNVVDLRPGTVFSVDHHPHPELAPGARLLMTELSIDGSRDGEWSTSGRAVFTDVPYRPPPRTPKPTAVGVQSATVVGPKGQEIHTDEFGRVRVQFPWDREGKNDDGSSCWIRVSQGWAGTGFGMITVPRIGQEVLVGYLQGDPDQPIIVGRVFNGTRQAPYPLPEHKTRSAWRSDSSPGSNGFNEIMFEDLKGRELVYMQAQRDLRKLVKQDETITVGNDRRKFVARDETEETGRDRTELTRANRTEITDKNRMTVVGGDAVKLVKGDEIERTDGSLVVYVGQDQDVIIKQRQRERVEGDSHLRVKGKRNIHVGRTQSLTVGKDRHEKIGRRHALEAGKAIHLKAGSALVIEASQDLTLKGPGGFIRIDASGVTIQGKLVRINSGGSAGSGAGASPEAAEDARVAEVAEPERPEPDDIRKTGLAQ